MSETRGIHCLQHNLLLLVSTQCCVIYLYKQIYISLVNTFIVCEIAKNATL